MDFKTPPPPPKRNDIKKTSDYKYEVVIYWNTWGGGSYTAEAPEFGKGCIATGSSYEEALKNIQLRIKEQIETAIEKGRPIPEPKCRCVHIDYRVNGKLQADIVKKLRSEESGERKK